MLKDRLLMFLVYYRMYTSYTLVGYLFDLDTANVYRDIKYLEPAVRECIPIPAKKYAETKKATTMEELEKHFPGLRIMIDGSEQEISTRKQEEEEDALFGQEEAPHGQERVRGKRRGWDSLQASPFPREAS